MSLDVSPHSTESAPTSASLLAELRGLLVDPVGYLRSRFLAGRTARDAAMGSVALSSSHLILTTVVTSLFGYVYWIAAARLADAATVGLTSALVSTMFLLTALSSLGLGLGAAYVLPTAGPRWSGIVNAILLTVLLLAVVASLLVAGGARFLGMEIGLVAESPRFLAVFVFTAAFWSLGYVVDNLLTVERATGLALLRNGLSSAIRLLLLPLPLLVAVDLSAELLFVAWGASALLSILVAGALFARRNRFGRRLDARVDPGSVRRILPLSLGNHVLSTGEMAPSFLLPLVVAEFLSTSATAYFYVAWMVAVLLHSIPSSTAKALFAHAAGEPLGRDVLNKVLLLTYAVLVPLAAATALVGPLALSLFGADYSREASGLLALLALAALPKALFTLYVASERIQRRFRRALVVTLVALAIVLVGSALAAGRFGLPGVGVAVLCAYAVVGLFCLYDLRFRARGSATPASSTDRPADP